MNDDRNYILDRLKSRKTTIDEFNFDNLKAPPLGMFLSQWDIQELTNIATSLKLSAKPEVRYKMIDDVMKRRGLVKFLSGTNRVTYRHPEFPDILFKVASDAVGMKDNPAEFYNQQLLKPFVTKIFEVAPSGVVAITERVNPITSREEFISVADDIFELITEWLVGEYVLADFGSTFFMNYGIRKGFGCVLLDYPYLYKLDGNKLYCNKPDNSSPSGKCDGIIDYDAGYNFLHCTKCGATYKAKELEAKIKNHEIINIDEGEKKMNVRIKGGSKKIAEREIRTMDVDHPAFAETLISTGHIGTNMKPAIKNAQNKAAAKVVVNTSDIGGSEQKFTIRTNKTQNSPTPVEEKVLEASEVKEVKKDESYHQVAPAKPIMEAKEAVPAYDIENDYNTKKGYPAKKSKKADKNANKRGTIPVAPVITEESAAHIVTEAVDVNEQKELSVNGVNSKAGIAESPFTISEETKKEFSGQDESCDREPSPVETIERSINIISRRMNEVDIDVVRDDLMERLFLAVCSMLPNNKKSFGWLISAAKDIIDADIAEGTIDVDSLQDIESIVNFVDRTIIEKSEYEDMENSAIEIGALKKTYQEDISAANAKIDALANDKENLMQEIEAITNARDVMADNLDKIEAERDQLKEDKAQLENELEELKVVQANSVDINDLKFTSDRITGLKSFSAVITDIADLLPTQTESQRLIALVNEDGKYAAVNGLMLCIDEVDGQLLNDMEFVSAEYINDLNAALETYMNNSGSPVEEYTEAETAAQYNESEYPVEDDGSAESANDAINLATQRFLEDEEKVEV